MINDDEDKNKKRIPEKLDEVKGVIDEDVMSFSWSAVCRKDRDEPEVKTTNGLDNFLSDKIDFVGKNLENGKFSKENLEGANFSVANLSGIDFNGANLKGADFSGANLSGADLSGANLQGAVFNGAQLIGTNFTGANLKGVTFVDADITDAILLDIEIDSIGLEELQALIEYLAKYYPHKLNLLKINLTLLDLSRIDLKNVNLRGVDFTGCSFVGVNIMELDLSECIITPEQIAQALGRVPSKEEMAQILAPKAKAKGGKGKGVDLDGLFRDDGSQFGVMDATRDRGTSIEDIINVGKKVFRHSAQRPPVKDKEVLDKIKEEYQKEAKSDKEELRAKIEENKRAELEKRRLQQKEATKGPIEKEEKTVDNKKKRDDRAVNERIMNIRDRSRD